MSTDLRISLATTKSDAADRAHDGKVCAARATAIMRPRVVQIHYTVVMFRILTKLRPRLRGVLGMFTRAQAVGWMTVAPRALG